MSDTEDLRGILLEQVDRLLADHAAPETLRLVEQGGFPAELWAEVEALGLPLALVPEAMGGAGLGWDDAVAVWVALGRFGAPIPLAENMAAAGLLAAAGIAPPEGVVLLAAPDGAVDWGRHAVHVVTATGGTVALHAAAGLPWEEGSSFPANEPRDRAPLIAPLASAAAAPEAALLAGALLTSAKMAGTLEAILATAVEYANTRKQFGRAIGQFQAVQQLLAQAAGEVAAAGVAVAHAGRAAARRGLAGAEFEIASAKVVTGEGANTVAAIIHQVFAAIGFTQEHHLHLFTRRLWSWRDAYGAERFWARRLGTAALARGGEAVWPDITARDEA